TAQRRLILDDLYKPNFVKRWLGPRGRSLAVCEIYLKVGGGWRSVLRGPNGRDMGMRGVYQEIVPPERLVSTESFDDYPGESQNTLVLLDDRGSTTLPITVLYQSKDIRDPD